MMATTTPLVRDIFERFFENQIAALKGTQAPRRKRCGVCEVRPAGLAVSSQPAQPPPFPPSPLPCRCASCRTAASARLVWT